jgi:hypothetical protein
VLIDAAPSSRSRKDMRTGDDRNPHETHTMRTFDFGCDLSLSPKGTRVVCNRHRLCLRLLAYLTFPEDAEQRHQVLAVREALFLQREFDRLEKAERECAHSQLEGKKGPVASREGGQQHLAVEKIKLIRENFQIFGGGFGPLAAAAYDKPLAERLERGLEAATLAGDRLLFTAAMARHHDNDLRGGASLGKATDLITQLNSESEGPTSKNPINAAWQSHRNVAHLSAAAGWIERKMRQRNSTPANEEIPIQLILEPTEEFLQLARDFLEFGLTFRAFRSPETILDKESVWHLPFNLGARPLERVLPPLPDEQLRYLREVRRAPIPMF